MANQPAALAEVLEKLVVIELDRHFCRSGLRLELAVARVAEVYASSDAQQSFVQHFAAAWSKVMELDRYDLK